MMTNTLDFERLHYYSCNPETLEDTFATPFMSLLLTLDKKVKLTMMNLQKVLSHTHPAHNVVPLKPVQAESVVQLFWVTV